MKLIIELYMAFFRVGLFTVGGGYAMLPMFQKELVEKYGWTSEEELLDCYALSQTTPGVIAVNVSTFIGYKIRGKRGGLAATLGVISPSIIIILLLAFFFNQFTTNIYVQKAFIGVRVAVVVLITNSVIKMWQKGVSNRILGLVACVAFVVVVFLKLSPLYVIVGAGVIGVLMSKARMNKLQEDEKQC